MTFLVPIINYIHLVLLFFVARYAASHPFPHLVIDRSQSQN